MRNVYTWKIFWIFQRRTTFVFFKPNPLKMESTLIETNMLNRSDFESRPLLTKEAEVFFKDISPFQVYPFRFNLKERKKTCHIYSSRATDTCTNRLAGSSNEYLGMGLWTYWECKNVQVNSGIQKVPFSCSSHMIKLSIGLQVIPVWVLKPAITLTHPCNLQHDKTPLI